MNKAVQIVVDLSGIISLCLSLYLFGVVEGMQKSIDESLRQLDRHISIAETKILGEFVRSTRAAVPMGTNATYITTTTTTESIPR